MAQSKLNEFAGKFPKGGPPGMSLGLKVLGVGAALAYGVSQAMYTGQWNTRRYCANCIQKRDITSIRDISSCSCEIALRRLVVCNWILVEIDWLFLNVQNYCFLFNWLLNQHQTISNTKLTNQPMTGTNTSNKNHIHSMLILFSSSK